MHCMTYVQPSNMAKLSTNTKKIISANRVPLHVQRSFLMLVSSKQSRQTSIRQHVWQRLGSAALMIHFQSSMIAICMKDTWLLMCLVMDQRLKDGFGALAHWGKYLILSMGIGLRRVSGTIGFVFWSWMLYFSWLCAMVLCQANMWCWQEELEILEEEFCQTALIWPGEICVEWVGLYAYKIGVCCLCPWEVSYVLRHG